MIKILIISESMTGGIRRHIIDYLDRADLNEFQIHIAYGKERCDKIFSSRLYQYREMGIHTYEIKHLKRKINIVNEVKAYLEIRNIIEVIKPDVVHCHSSKAGGIGRIAAKVHGINKIIYTPHAYIMLDKTISVIKKQIYMNIERLLAFLCTSHTVHVSKGEFFFAQANHIGFKRKHSVIYNGIDLRKENKLKGNLRSRLGLSENEVLFGAAMRLYKPKDPITFYKIARNVLKRYLNTHALIIGDSVKGYKEELVERVRCDGLEERFHFLGFCEDASKLIADLDVYLFTSIYEGLPYSLLEALKENVPIVATDIDGNREIIVDDINGFLFEVGNVPQGTERLSKIIEDKNLRLRLGSQCFRILEEKFNVLRMVKKIENIYKGEVKDEPTADVQ